MGYEHKAARSAAWTQAQLPLQEGAGSLALAPAPRPLAAAALVPCIRRLYDFQCTAIIAAKGFRVGGAAGQVDEGHMTFTFLLRCVFVEHKLAAHPDAYAWTQDISLVMADQNTLRPQGTLAVRKCSSHALAPWHARLKCWASSMMSEHMQA
jgi:hypothetical protein